MYGDKIVLATTKAKRIKDNDRRYMHLINTVDGLSIAAGIPRPKIHVIESDDINAYATGRNPENSSIAVTTGLLKNLKRDEIEGVIGHELSHIKNYDIRYATFIAVLVGLVAILSNLFLRSFRFKGRKGKDGEGFAFLIIIGFILAIFSPIIVRIVQFSISRKREFLADSSSVQLTRYPEGLASALDKISKINKGRLKVSEAVSHLFFADPNKSALDALYATHPPIEERIKILKSM
jgi:heat shock protein HtpX